TVVYSILALAALSGCSGSPESGEDIESATSATSATTVLSDPKQAPAAAPDARVTHALPRGGESTASIHTLPRSVCTLHGADEAPRTVERLTLFADDDGVVRLHLRHQDPSVDHAALSLDCKDDAGRTITHAIDLTVDEAAASQAPERYSRAGKRTL